MEFLRQYEIPPPTPGRSLVSESLLFLLKGQTTLPDLLAEPESIISGQNVWVQQQGLTPRWRLSAASSSNTIPTLNGAFQVTHSVESALNNVFIHFDLDHNVQAPIMLAVSGGALLAQFALGTAGSNSSLSWSPLSFVSANGDVSIGPTGGSGLHFWNGATVYSSSRNSNFCVIAGGDIGATSPLPAASYCYVYGSAATQRYSNLTGAPGAQDVCCFDNRAVLWNCQSGTTVGTITAIPQRVQWHVAGDPENWTGLGSGSEDLVDMQGCGTRIFTQDDQMILASQQEIWRGRAVGLPFVFSFSPITRKQGIPYAKAALQTPQGIFWLDSDYCIYRMVGEQISPVNTDVQIFLRDLLANRDNAFFTYNARLQHLRLHFGIGNNGSGNNVAYNAPTHSVTFDLLSKTWTHEAYSHFLHTGLCFNYSGLATLQGSPVGPVPWGISEYLFTSHGTCAYFAKSATSDLGSATTEDAVFGTLQATDLRTQKIADEIRLDLAARSASSISFHFSGDNGTSYSFTTKLALSASSNCSQYILYPQIRGNYFTQRIQSTSGAWELRREYLRFRPDGEAR